MTIREYSLPELVDLALHTPILGVVDYGILRTILHILIKETGLQTYRTKVNLTDMKPQMIEIPQSSRPPSDIVASIAEEEADGGLIQEMEEIRSNTSTEINTVEDEANKLTSPTKETVLKATETLTSDVDLEEESVHSSELKLRSETKTVEEGQSSTASADLYFKEPIASQEDLEEFRKTTSMNSRITALEGGIEKIVDIIDEQARDLEHFRRDTERRRSTDKSNVKEIQEKLDELCQKANELTVKADAYVTKEDFTTTLEDHQKYVIEISNQLKDVEESLGNFDEKLEGDYKMADVLYDITDIKSILKTPTDKQLSKRFGTENIQFGEYPPDMQQVLGAAAQLEEIQTKGINIESKLEEIEDSNRDMQRQRAVETMANEDKMVEIEGVIGNLSGDMTETKQQIGEFEELLKASNDKLSSLTETVSEAIKIQDEMIEEGRKNLLEVEEQIRDIFKELKKLKMLDDMQFQLEDMKNFKADREELIEGLDRKADKMQLDEKLDKATYAKACEEKNSIFDGINSKFAAQEQSLERSVQDLTFLLNQKIERKEMDSHREVLNDRLKLIVTKIKQLKEAAEEGPMAAGIKTRCLSCDRPLRQSERRVVISDPSRNQQTPKYIADYPPQGSGLLPPISDGRSAGGVHTLTSSFYVKGTPAVISQHPKLWEKVPLQGTDGRIYQGYLEKPEYKRTL